MREDMKHVIIDRPRKHHGLSYKNIRRGKKPQEWDDYPSREGMREPYGHDLKTQTDRLSPLHRWLAKQVGRPWSKIFSEACAFNDHREIRGHHIRSQGSTGGHLFDNVDVDGSHRYYSFDWKGDSSFEYLVDENGILRKNPSYRRSTKRSRRANEIKRQSNLDVRKFPGRNNNVELHRIDGLWYEVRLENAEILKDKDGNEILRPRWDVVNRSYKPVYEGYRERRYLGYHRVDGQRSLVYSLFKYYELARYAVNKRQLSRKEMERYGLS